MKKEKDFKTNKTDFYNDEISNNQILLWLNWAGPSDSVQKPFIVPCV